MSKQLVRIYAGIDLRSEDENAALTTVDVLDVELVNDERLSIVTVEWGSSQKCSPCGSYPPGKLVFTLKLQRYNNAPSRARKRRSYAVLGTVSVWIVQNRKWLLKDWHRISLREAGVIEIPRAILTNRCVISHMISLLGPLVPYVYKPSPVFIEALVCPECFEAIDIPLMGVNDNFDASFCSIIPSHGNNAVCVPIPDCVPIPPTPATPFADGWPAIPSTPIGGAVNLSSDPLPRIPPPCYEAAFAVMKTVIRTNTGGTSVQQSQIHYNKAALQTCPPLAGFYKVVYSTQGDQETGNFILSFPVFNNASQNNAYNFITNSGSSPGGRLEYSVEVTVNSVLIPCGYTFDSGRCQPCASGKWEMIVVQKGESPTLNSGPIPNQYSRITIEGTDCCRPTLEEMTAQSNPDLYDPDFEYYVWQQCGNYTAYNQAIQNVYTPTVLYALFIAD